MTGKIIDLYRILSLDICLGVSIMTYYFARLSTHKVPAINYVIIFLAVFSIYSIDHLIDAVILKKTASTVRHRFFQKNKTVLCIVTLIIIIADLILTYFYLPLSYIKAGSVLSILVIIYFAVNYFSFRFKFRNIYKELISSVIYTAGVALPALTLSFRTEKSTLLNMIQILLIVYLNLIIFSYFDFENDTNDGYSSLSTSLGKALSLKVIYSVFIIFLILTIIKLFFFSSGVLYTILPLLMTGSLFLIIFFRDRFKENFRYRYFGDSIFLYPILLLFL